MDSEGGSLWIPYCRYHDQESIRSLDNGEGDAGDSENEPDLQRDDEHPFGNEEYRRWLSCEEGGEEQDSRGVLPVTSEKVQFISPLHKEIMETITSYLPRNESELTKILFDNGSTAMLKPDFDRVSRILLSAHQNSFLDKTWEEILNTTPDLYFDKNPVYLTVDESVDWFGKIMNHNHIDVSEFVNNAFKVMNKILPKKNALMILGRPNGGKTLVAESIANSIVYSETLSTFNGNSSFEFQPMMNRRCCLFNEPKICDKTVEIMKCILEGCTVSIDVKFKTGQTLSRTPVILATNENLVFYTTAKTVNMEAFKARTFDYDFKPFDDLKNCNGKLHPRMWKTLISQYVT